VGVARKRRTLMMSRLTTPLVRTLFALAVVLLLGIAWRPRERVLLAASQQQGTEQKLTLYIGTEPRSLDPHKSSSIPDIGIETLLFRSLFRFDAGGSPVPA